MQNETKALSVEIFKEMLKASKSSPNHEKPNYQSLALEAILAGEAFSAVWDAMQNPLSLSQVATKGKAIAPETYQTPALAIAPTPTLQSNREVIETTTATPDWADKPEGIHIGEGIRAGMHWMSHSDLMSGNIPLHRFSISLWRKFSRVLELSEEGTKKQMRRRIVETYRQANDQKIAT